MSCWYLVVLYWTGGYLFSLMAMSQSLRSFTLLNSLLLGNTESSLLFAYMIGREMGSGPWPVCFFCLPCQFWHGIEVSALCLARAALRITLQGLSWNRHSPVLSPLPRSHG